MPGIDASPSTGFWNRLAGGGLPGMLSSMGQQLGPSWLRPVAGALGTAHQANQEKKKKPTTDMPTSDTGNRGTAGAGIVRPYSGMNAIPGQLNFGNMATANPNMFGMGGAGPMNLGNIGTMGNTNMYGNGNPAGLWGAYNRLSGLGPSSDSVPKRGLFF